MRQAGIVAAAGLYALEHHVDRLAEDHANAERLAAGLAGIRGLEVEPPQTNMVFVRIPADSTAGTEGAPGAGGRARAHRSADAARHASRRLGVRTSTARWPRFGPSSPEPASPFARGQSCHNPVNAASNHPSSHDTRRQSRCAAPPRAPRRHESAAFGVGFVRAQQRPRRRKERWQQSPLSMSAKHWGATRAVDDVSFDGRGGDVRRAARAFRLRQVHHAAADRRARDGHARPRPHRRGDVTEAPPSKRNIAMVFQSYALFPHLTVAENIVFGLRVRKVPAAERERAAEARGRAARPRQAARSASPRSSPAASSSAWRSAARSSPRHPVCLMDEPLSNLDAQLRARDAPRDPRAAAEARHHHGLRDPRPDRGDDHGRPGGPAARRPHRAGRRARRSSTRARPPRSPRASSARRR